MEEISALPLGDFLSVQLLIHGTRQLEKNPRFFAVVWFGSPFPSSSSMYRQPSNGYKGREREREGERKREREGEMKRDTLWKYKECSQ
jgi:hypothetical protein